MSEKEFPKNSEFQHEDGAPQSQEEWDQLSEEDKLFWEQRRRRRTHLRRHGQRPKGLGQYVNPRNQSLGSGDLLRGKGKARPNLVDKPLSKPHENKPEGKSLEPTRDIPDSGNRGESGLTHIGDMRLVRKARRERWRFDEEALEEIPEILMKIVHGMEDFKPETSIAAARVIKDLMAQNQADEHEEIKRSSLTKEQAAELMSVILNVIREEVTDSGVRQKVVSRLGVEMVRLGIFALPGDSEQKRVEE